MSHITRALVLVAILGACDRKPAAQESISVQDSAGLTIVTIHAAPDSVPRWELGEPELVLSSPPDVDPLFGLVRGAAWLSNGAIVVADYANHRLQLFDSTGRHARTIGRRGAGPGEFGEIIAMAATASDTIYVNDRAAGRMAVFAPNGDFVRVMIIPGEANLEAWADMGWPFGSDRLVILRLKIRGAEAATAGASMRRFWIDARLTLHGSEGVHLASSASFDGPYTGQYATGGDTQLPFATFPVVALGRNQAFYGSGQRYSLTVLDADFKPIKEIRWPGQEYALTERHVDSFAASFRRLAATEWRMTRDQIEQRLSHVLAKEILPDTRPAIGRLLIGSDGRLWVGRFEPSATRLLTDSRHWTILGGDGTPLGRLTLPPQTRLEAAQRGRVLLVAKDSLDVERVEIRRVIEH